MCLLTACRVAAIACVGTILLAGSGGAWAQNYWAGDVSMAPSAEDNLNQPTPREMPLVAPPAANTNVDVPPQDGPQLTTQTRQVLDFYGGRSARATLNQIPRATAISSAPVASMPLAARRSAKPFRNEDNSPTLSPYLNLFRDENATQGIPNYQAFVQPKLEQQAAVQRQQIQSQRLQRRGQPAAAAGGQNGGSATAGTSTAAHFMDTAQFYGSWH
jgi:hypothetical protein